MLKCATAPMFCSSGVWFQAFRWHTQRKSPAPAQEPRKRIIGKGLRFLPADF